MRQNRRNFIRNAAILGGAISLPGFAIEGQGLAGPGFSPTGPKPDGGDNKSVRQQFQSPPKKYRPLARWWWPGNDVSDSELRREIEVLDMAGFGGAEIQSFVKGFATKDLTEAQMQRIDSFASASFFRHVAVAAEEARKHGMFIDYTFGSGWPFGGGNEITPELASIELRSSHQSVEGPAKFTGMLQIPSITDGDPSHGSDILKGLPDGWAERVKKRTKVVGVVAVRGTDAQWDRNQGGWARAKCERIRRTGKWDIGRSDCALAIGRSVELGCAAGDMAAVCFLLNADAAESERRRRRRFTACDGPHEFRCI